jgi:hypothetical protein
LLVAASALQLNETLLGGTGEVLGVDPGVGVVIGVVVGVGVGVGVVLGEPVGVGVGVGVGVVLGVDDGVVFVVKCFACQFGESSDVFVDVVVLHSQVIEVCGGSVWFVCVGPRLDKFFLEIFVDSSVWSGRSRDGQNPVLCTSLPFVDVRAIHISERVGDFLPWVHHYWVCSVYELIESEFVEKMIGFLSVSVEDRGFFPLEWFVVSLDWIWLLR